MNILLCGRYLYPPMGGAEYSLLTLAEELSKKHKVKILSTGIKETVKVQKIIITKYPYKAECRVRFFHKLKSLKKEFVEDFNPDIIFAQHSLIEYTVNYGLKKKIPVIIFLRDYEFFRGRTRFYPNPYIPVNLRNKIRYLRFVILDEFPTYLAYKKLLREATLVISNSKFMSNICKEQMGVFSPIIYPFIRTKDYLTKNKNEEGFIVHINPSIHKGIMITLKIAKKDPHHNFMIVGEMKKEIKKKLPDNVFVTKGLKDVKGMREVYSKAKIILMPSIYPEPFGRIPVEAGINGIPTIASKVGGLPEAVGRGGILIEKYINIKRWIEAINFLENPGNYSDFSKRAIENARKLDIKYTFSKFCKIIKDYLSIDL